MSEQMFEHKLIENRIELMMAIVIEMVIMIEMMVTIAMFFIEVVVAMVIEIVAMVVMLFENIVKMLIEIATMKFPTAVEIEGVETKRGMNSDEDAMVMIENTMDEDMMAMIEDTIVKVLTTGTGQVGSTSPQSRMVEIAETKIENDIVKQYEQESSTRRTR